MFNAFADMYSMEQIDYLYYKNTHPLLKDQVLCYLLQLYTLSLHRHVSIVFVA